MASVLLSLQKLQKDALQSAEEKYRTAISDADRVTALQEYDTVFQYRNKELHSSLARDPSAAEDAEVARELISARDEISRLEVELQTASQETQNAYKAPTAHADSSMPCASYLQFIIDRSKLRAYLTQLQEILSGYPDGTNALVSGKWGGRSILTDEGWDSSEANVKQAISTLTVEAERVKRRVPNASLGLEVVHRLRGETRVLVPVARQVAFDAAAKHSATREAREEIEQERKTLLVWCRQQKSNLDALSDPDHIQDFCASVLQNYPVMEENFATLLEMAEPLLPDTQLHQSLLEANEVWLNLQVGTYDRLRQALLEIHPKSKLEDEVREYSNFTTRVDEFLDSFHELVTGPSDPESMHYVRPAIEQCEAIQAEFSNYARLPKSLNDFSFNMEILRDSYSNLRRAVLSRLTFITSPVPALTASMRRKEEYGIRTRELKRWVDAKSQGETWRQINDRITSIKSLIEKEQASLLAAKAAHDKKVAADEEAQLRATREAQAQDEIYAAMNKSAESDIVPAD